MFVRWKHRQLRHGHDVAHYAVLVESKWRDGKTRQRVVCYLAHIREQYRTAPAHRDWFWHRVEERLDAMDLEPAVRQVIETRLAETVSRPSDAELAQIMATRKLLEQFEP